MQPLTFACPNCAVPLGDALACAKCGRLYVLKDGIYRFLLPEREQSLAAFLAQYRRVRQQDGYRARPGDYYLSLPRVDPGDPQAQQWRVRAETYRHLLERLPTGPTAGGQPLAVLDLGAGNAWLSHRLSALGHRCVAVDWLADADDGLGAAAHYEAAITCVQADFDRLPFAPGQYDLVIYNASLHYAPSLAGSVEHARQMLSSDGMLAIMDSPTFRSRASGERMLVEQAQRLERDLSTGQAIRPGQGYLLASKMTAIGRRQGIELRYQPTRGGLTWALRRRLAGLKLRREPASFGLWFGALSHQKLK